MKKINSLQFCTCFYTLLVFALLGSGMYGLLIKSGVDSLIAILGSFIIGIIILFVFLYMLNYEPEKNLKQKIFSVFPKSIGIIILTILCCCFFFFGTVYLYDINNFVISQFLSETPLVIVGIVFTFLIIYINYKGIEVLTRVSTIFFAINILFVLLALAGEIRHIDISNLKPVLEFGYKPVLQGSIYATALFISPIFIMLLIPKKNIVANHKTNKYIIITYILGFCFLVLVTFITLSVLGINLSVLYQYPGFMVPKRINIFGFIDRIENFLIIEWIFQVFIALSLIIYFINKVSEIKTPIIAITMLIVSLMVFRNNTFFNYIISNYLPYIGFIIIILFFLIYIAILKKRKY